MKTNIIANNSVINTIMKNVVKYLCTVVLLIGTSAHAWASRGTFDLPIHTGTLVGCTYTGPSYIATGHWDENVVLTFDIADGYDPDIVSISVTTDGSTYEANQWGTYTMGWSSSGRVGTLTLYASFFCNPDPSRPIKYGDDVTINLTVGLGCTSRTLTFANATVNKTYGNAAGKYQSYTLSAGGGTETWESSNTSVATVNNSGNVTIVGAGSTTITAKRAVSGDYCAVEGSYTLNVAAIAPTVNNTHLTKGTVTSTSVAYSGGQVSNKGGAAITRYGYVLGTSSSVEFGTALKKTYTSSDVTLNTDFASKTLSGLTPNTTYYVRAFAYNGTAYGYGTAVSFTTLQRYTITYNNNGGEGTIDNQYKDYGVSATLNAGTNFSRTGYTLSRWDSNSSGTGNSYALSSSYTTNSNVNLYAVWTPNPYTITLNNQDATSGGTSSISVTYNANTNLSGTPAITVPTKTGYTFGGYYTGIGGEGNQIIAANGNVNASVDGFTDGSKRWIYANSIELFAYWTANTINLTLDKNGVTGTDGSASVKYDATALESGRTDATNSDANYHLVGYYAEAGTTTKVLESNGAFAAENVSEFITSGQWTCATSPTTLYAKWVMTTYTVTFNMHGHGDAIASQEVESGSKVAKPAEPEEGDAVDGWRFLGWFTDNGVGSATSTKFDFSNTTITANTTIHAQWEEITYSTAYKAWCEPDISITGDIHLTSVNGIAVYATSTTSNLIRIQSDDLAGVNKLEIKYLDADDGDAEVAKGSSVFRLCNDGISPDNYNVADGSQIDVSASNTCNLSYSISYTPSDYNLTHHYKLQITMKHGTNVLKTVTHDLYGRSLPEEFVIATKGNDGIWYALPNTIVDNTNAVAPIRITVDNQTTPTAATYAPNTTVYKGDGRYNNAANRYAVRFTDGVLNNEDKLNHLQISSNTDTHYPWLSYSGSSTNQDWWLKSTDCSAYELNIPTSDATSSYKLGIYSGNIGYFSSVTSGPIYILPITNKIVDNPAIVTEWGQNSVILDVDAQGMAGARAHIGDGAVEVAASFGQTRTSVAASASKYNYTVSFSTTDFSMHKGELLYIDWLDNEANVVSTSAVTIPWIIATNSVMGNIDNVQSHWKDWEVHVLPGVTLEADGSSFTSSTAKVHSLEIYPGATVNVSSGILDVTQDLVLRNGWTRANGKEYDVARLYIPSTSTLKTNHVYADWYIDFDQYYPVAVPWNVTTSGMSYKNSKSAASAGVKLRYYDGESRANNGQAGVGEGANWKEYSSLPGTLTPGLGYAMTAKRPTGKAFSIIRMPLTIPDASWTTSGEQGEVTIEMVTTHKDEVDITAWSVSDDSKPIYSVGWNFIANPYMAIYQGPITHSEGDEYDVEYVNIPDIDFKNYGQYPVGALGRKLLPATGFFIQAAETGKLTFGTTNRKASVPSYRKEETTPVTSKQKAYIVLNNEDADDMMGLVISEKYTAAYEINADLEKLLGDGNNLKTYMRYGDMNMAYLAINSALAQEWIPVSVQLPEGGEYTFSLHEASVVEELEGVYLIDYAAGNIVTNLLDNNYSFGSAPGTITNRFAINAIVGEHQTPTNIDVVNGGGDINSDKPFKFIYHEKVYIYHRGVIYDATGKKVKGGLQ